MKYVLTPRRKHLGKAVARRSRKTVAVESMRDPSTRHHIVNLLGKEIRNEIRLMASDSAHSILRSQLKEDLTNFQWSTLHAEMSSKAPILQSVLTAATKTRVIRPNTHIVVGTCVAILLKHQNLKMSLLQKIISLVLYCAIQTYARLQKLNLTMSYQQLLRLVDKLGMNHDEKVLGWRDALVIELRNRKPPQVSCYK